MYEKDEETDYYGFFCDLEENRENRENRENTKKYNKENYDFIIRISSQKKITRYNICYHISLGISIIVTAIIIFKIK
jgi:hypothetical protein